MLIKLFHGSYDIIKEPKLELGKPNNDFGRGFYCTESIELAKEWACQRNTDGFANEYFLNMDGLNVLNLMDKSYGVLNWLALLVKNRFFDNHNKIEKDAMKFLFDKYLIDLESYDVIIGPRADDSFFAYAKAFLKNTITIEELEEIMAFGDMGTQIVLISNKAFHQLVFSNIYIAKRNKYYAKFHNRDSKARNDYQNLLQSETRISGTYIIDLIRKEKRKQ